MFKEALERTDGSIGALIMGTDGIAVEKVLSAEAQDANLDVAAAEFTSLIRNAQRTGNVTGLGNLRELVVQLDNAVFVMRLFSRDYFVVLALKPDGNFGRGRFELRKAELQLAREFAV
jgi:predicted regulator of Ras-like GTPase activity (Roadblock/LC7/MglB family)